MKKLNVHEAKAQLSALIEAAERGEEVVIARYGKPVVRLVAVTPPTRRTLGFFPMRFSSDLEAPTESAIVDDFYREEV